MKTKPVKQVNYKLLIIVNYVITKPKFVYNIRIVVKNI